MSIRFELTGPRARALVLCVLASALALAFAPRDVFPSSPFTRGDCNADGNIAAGTLCDISDSIFLLNHLFLGGATPPCLEACDVNDDGEMDISDAVYGLIFCFVGGSPPPAPFPECGRDPGPSLGCASFPACLDCSAQDAVGVGPCDAIVGIFWDGFRCAYHSGCSCEGEDCGAGYKSIEDCYRARAGCPSICDPLDVRGEGLCDMVLGIYWDGTRCRTLSGCSCEGKDCDRLFASQDECEAAVLGCPSACGPMDAQGSGPCAMILGYAWNGSRCVSLSGCSCEGEDCAGIFGSQEECEAAFEGCR